MYTGLSSRLAGGTSMRRIFFPSVSTLSLVMIQKDIGRYLVLIVQRVPEVPLIPVQLAVSQSFNGKVTVCLPDTQQQSASVSVRERGVGLPDAVWQSARCQLAFKPVAFFEFFPIRDRRIQFVRTSRATMIIPWKPLDAALCGTKAANQAMPGLAALTRSG